MPIYEYACPFNKMVVEVLHGIQDSIQNWGELCALADIPEGDTPLESPVNKIVSLPSMAFPKTNSELKNLGFTKLVKRDNGVYENVTATRNEKRYMRSDDPNSLPDLKRKISD